VDEATWGRVQDLLELKRDGFHRLRDQHSETRFAYRGLWCAACGRPLYGCTKPKHGRGKTRRLVRLLAEPDGREQGARPNTCGLTWSTRQSSACSRPSSRTNGLP
jgi:hypothetical protein